MDQCQLVPVYLLWRMIWLSYNLPLLCAQAKERKSLWVGVLRSIGDWLGGDKFKLVLHLISRLAPSELEAKKSPDRTDKKVCENVGREEAFGNNFFEVEEKTNFVAQFWFILVYVPEIICKWCYKYFSFNAFNFIWYYNCNLFGNWYQMVGMRMIYSVNFHDTYYVILMAMKVWL